MSTVLPECPKIQIKQDTSLPDENRIREFDAMILIMDADGEAGGFQTANGAGHHLPTSIAKRAQARLAQSPEGSGPFFLSAGEARLALLRVSDRIDTFGALNLMRKAMAGLMDDHPQAIALINCGMHARPAERLAEAAVAALLAARFPLPKLGKPPKDPAAAEALTLFGNLGAPDIHRAEATAEGNNLARWLTHLPPNHLTPGRYRELAETLAEREGWTSRFLGVKELRRLGAGAFLSVVEASPTEDAGILHLQYRPSGASGQPFTLVGKGICFDTGGTNLKSADGMYGMHGDMQGSAVALGSLLALSRLGFTQPVDCWLALAENHIGSRAAKPNDVVTAVDGTTIEIVNTDAEGRMVLADTLALARRERPRAILDYATLTGSCVTALGHRISGAISNRPDWIQPLLDCGQRTGERVWPLPYAEDYDEDLESGVADVLQCRPPAEADHLYAARFLGRFVGTDIPWVHVDLSAGHRKGGLGHIGTDITGFGVRFGVEWMHFLQDNQELSDQTTG
ncbi:M17 family metallopeptidase [Natronospira bacteriovora]|uniref:Leucyl aminopeptidase family protein n=1 Tax=Natronospira bacteriovora TaxID=3069753 RepID=A0ABU0W5Q8_9GAMM|nr:leucyl aminopeptidase family protein [Natronospira sp. AB-CW4]MDQ2069354.1 leucyl aminopeptidase family protein [Natronospira sp. AB-CW4]